MQLAKEEQEMLAGKHGKGIQKAMEILNALGEIYGAERMADISSAQIAGVSYKNLGDAGIEVLNMLANEGARVKVPTTLNPAGMDLDAWEALGFDRAFAEKQMQVIDAYRRLGVTLTCTCTPYFVGNVPRFGDSIAWSESSAICFANSVLGARTNRESGVSALAAAIVGKTPLFGFHLDGNRKAGIVIDVDRKISEDHEFAALGYWAGSVVKSKVPYFRGIAKASTDNLKALGAGLAASGSVALYHVEGITPEAKVRKDLLDGVNETIAFTEKEYKAVSDKLNTVDGNVDFVCIGCPHTSIEEIKKVSELISGKKVNKATVFWVVTSKPVKAVAERMGYLKAIETAGGRIVTDTCMVVAPIPEMGFKTTVTNSAKAAHYCLGYNLKVGFGSLEQCVNAAVTGVWK